jgi:hypothetical protein
MPLFILPTISPQAMISACFAGPFVVGESPARSEGDRASEARWENEGGRLGRLAQCDEITHSVFSLELVRNRDGTEAILYVYRNGRFAKTVTGQYTLIRESARQDYVGAHMHEIGLAA